MDPKNLYITKGIVKLLKKKEKDFLTINQVKNGLSSKLLRSIGLEKKTSTQVEILKRLRPCFGKDLRDYKGPRNTYIGHNMTLAEMLLRKIVEKPGLSSKQLRNSLPMVNKNFIFTLNSLLISGKIICTLNEKDHTPRSIKIPTGRTQKRPLSGDTFRNAQEGRRAFKNAYDKIGKGLTFVRIHRIREFLDWPQKQFDRILTSLRRDNTIQLHGGDPSIMSEKEIRNSFTDDKSRLYITAIWRAK